MPLSHNLGFPHLGAARELKRATEGYWSGKVSQADLLKTGAALRERHWRLQQDAGMDLVPSNDFSYYDRVLDTCALVGAVPKRYGWAGGPVDLDTYFAMARGVQTGGRDVTAMEMTKWFDTNYHYIVPEFEPGQAFRLSSSKPVDEFLEAKALGIRAKPVLIGPVTFLLLGKTRTARFDRLALLDALLPVYADVLSRLAAAGATWVQLDEPCLALDRTPAEREAFGREPPSCGWRHRARCSTSPSISTSSGGSTASSKGGWRSQSRSWWKWPRWRGPCAMGGTPWRPRSRRTSACSPVAASPGASTTR